jgi:hypothetical protein
MKTLFHLCAGLMLVCLLGGCAWGEKGDDDERLVKQAFQLVNDNNPKALYAMLVTPDGKNLPLPSQTRRNKGYLLIMNTTLGKDPQMPDRVFYSCRVPGAAIVAMSNVMGRQFYSKTAGLYSKDVSLEGSFRIRTDEATGEKKIIIEDGRNPFSLFFRMAYSEEKIPTVTQDMTGEELTVNMLTGVYIAGTVYADALGETEEGYMQSVLVPEFKACTEHLDAILMASLMDGDSKKLIGKTLIRKREAAQAKPSVAKEINWRTTGEIAGGALLLAGILALLTRCVYKLRKRRANRETWETKRKEKELYRIIQVFLNPSGADTPDKRNNTLRQLSEACDNESGEMTLQTCTAHDRIDYLKATRSGWALAAFARLIAKDCTPERFHSDMERFQKTVAVQYETEYNALRKTLEDIVAKAKAIEAQLKYQSLGRLGLEREYRQLVEQHKETVSKLQTGILSYAMQEDCLPFAYIMQIIGDSQGRFDRFVRQGALMGMTDFLTKHREHEYVKPYFEMLTAARAQMVASDDKMSFFEVRAPQHCTVEEYAPILGEVLRCTAPAVPFCDTLELMRTAEREIPGVMDLLIQYPLRLIDPGNRQVEGFYTFEPYQHMMWYRYTPPKDTGTVHKRYHEVLDMTVPNSVGLNIRLFTNPYAAIPTLFHEFCHYMEDPNEAGVFLRTYAFSRKFYRKYPKADPAGDPAFAAMQSIFGKRIKPAKVDGLNRLIIRYYGEALSEKAAIQKARQALEYKNLIILMQNSKETWCPEVRYPLLNTEEDRESALTIAEVTIRYAQVPRTLSRREATAAASRFMPVTAGMYRKWKRLDPGECNTTKRETDDMALHIHYPRWTTFKDWCLRKGYIRRYRDEANEERIKQAALEVIEANKTKA